MSTTSEVLFLNIENHYPKYITHIPRTVLKAKNDGLHYHINIKCEKSLNILKPWIHTPYCIPFCCECSGDF